MGFCIFNNMAVAAQAALDEFGLSRVLIFDWDVHHGNGTQDIFYGSPERPRSCRRTSTRTIPARAIGAKAARGRAPATP